MMPKRCAPHNLDWLLDEDEDDEFDHLKCVACSRLIGDEVRYGGDWPLCEDCAGTSDTAESDPSL